VLIPHLAAHEGIKIGKKKTKAQLLAENESLRERLSELIEFYKSREVTITEETGHYTRKKKRWEKKSKTETLKVRKNTKKVLLGEIGSLQIYAIPFDYEEKVFMGIYPASTSMDIYDIPRLMAILNKVRYYLEGEWKGSDSATAKKITKAYNEGLKKMQEDKYVEEMHKLHENDNF